VKEQFMYDGLKFKFTQHEELRKMLLDTKDSKLVEHTNNDKYWADGGDGSGKNRLGTLLMKLRDELRG
jgi:N-glycosidase YbiA